MSVFLVILTLRVWAVWKRSKVLGIALSILLLAAAASCYVFTGLFQHGLKCELINGLPPFFNCSMIDT